MNAMCIHVTRRPLCRPTLPSDVNYKVCVLGIRRRVRGTRAGCKVVTRLQLRPITVLCTTSRDQLNVCKHYDQLIPSLTSTLQVPMRSRCNLLRVPLVIDVPTNCSTVVTGWTAPTVYVLNGAAITKPHATQHLASDLLAYNVDIAIISESHLKKKHAGQHVSIDGYQLFRHDRLGRRGGEVAVYVTNSKLAEVWLAQFDNSAFELMWVTLQSGCREVIVGAFYHPPKPSYQPDQLLDYIERCTGALMIKSLSALVILAGDFNSLVSDDITSITGMLSIVKQPTRGANCLDKIFVNELCYDGVIRLWIQLSRVTIRLLSFSVVQSQPMLLRKRPAIDTGSAHQPITQLS